MKKGVEKPTSQVVTPVQKRFIALMANGTQPGNRDVRCLIVVGMK
jgi:hypothetical protein